MNPIDLQRVKVSLSPPATTFSDLPPPSLPILQASQKSTDAKFWPLSPRGVIYSSASAVWLCVKELRRQEA